MQHDLSGVASFLTAVIFVVCM